MGILTVKFFVGAALLVLGAEWLVRGATTIARKFNIPAHVTGLTLVALGTSAPELFVNVLAAWEGNTEFALANVSGSNLANICIGFGLCALLARTEIRRRDFFSDCLLLWLAPVVVLIMLQIRANVALPWISVVPLSLVLGYYLWSLKGRANDVLEVSDVSKSEFNKGCLQFLGGVAGLYFGGEFVVGSAIAIATLLKVGADVIALTIVAFGTSIPDITASVVAARRGEHGIAAGNILGSNISNIGLVLNATLLVNSGDLMSNAGVRMDYVFVTVVSLLVFGLAFYYERIPKAAAWVMILAYAGYLVLRIA